MNYNVLRYFSVLAQVEHYTIAAARLGISQPSLSSAIHNLENELGGVRLFEKVGRNIRLTEEGKFYREKVDAALNELHSASLTLRNSRISAPVVIRMGVVSGTLDGLLARMIAAYLKENERIRFHLTESSAANLMDMIRQEKLDLAIVDSTDRDRSLHFRMLGKRSFYVAMPEGHPLCERELIDPKEVIAEPQVVFNYSVTESFREWSSGAYVGEKVVCTVDTAQAALDLVAAGVGIAFVSGECRYRCHGVRYVPIKNWHQALYLCILYDKWLEPPVWDFVESVVRVLRDPEEKK